MASPSTPRTGELMQPTLEKGPDAPPARPSWSDRQREDAGGVRAGGRAIPRVVRGAAPRGRLHPDSPGIGADGEAPPRRDPHARRLARRQLDPWTRRSFPDCRGGVHRETQVPGAGLDEPKGGALPRPCSCRSHCAAGVRLRGLSSFGNGSSVASTFMSASIIARDASPASKYDLPNA